VCEPREKSQRVCGRERDAGWDRRRGTLKREREAMPPEARRAMEMERSWAAVVVVGEAIVGEVFGEEILERTGVAWRCRY